MFQTTEICGILPAMSRPFHKALLAQQQRDQLLHHRTRLALINKAQNVPLDADPQHKYSHRTGNYGSYEYHYTDPGGNYWKYTNAPGDSAHHDPLKGTPMIDPHQAMPHTAPEYFTQDGKKRHMAVPTGADLEQNAKYDPADPQNVWYEKYKHPTSGREFYTYLDKDVRDNPTLYIQHQLRLVDAGILRYRKLVIDYYLSGQQRNVALAVLLMLVDQAYYDLGTLLEATVGDLEFIGNTVVLCGRKFIPDSKLYYTLTKLVTGRDHTQPLFFQQTMHGTQPFGTYFVQSVFKRVGLSPKFVLYWHATQMYSQIIHRLVEQEVDGDLDKEALKELAQYLHTEEDVQYLVDRSVRKKLRDATKLPHEVMSKSLNSDRYGVPYVRTDLLERTEEEQAFSMWLHTQPMHEQDVVDVPEEAAKPTQEELSPGLTKSVTFICPRTDGVLFDVPLCDVLLVPATDHAAVNFGKSVLVSSQNVGALKILPTLDLATVLEFPAQNVAVAASQSNIFALQNAALGYNEELNKSMAKLDTGHYTTLQYLTDGMVVLKHLNVAGIHES